MERWKLAKICGDLLKVLTELDIKTDDWRNLEMYSEFERRKSRGEKISYIVEILAEHYGVSVRQVYRTVKRLGVDDGFPYAESSETVDAPRE